jgi:glycosyltransferase involved in cell wall biosynthesis
MKTLPSIHCPAADKYGAFQSVTCSASKIRVAILVNFLTSYREGFYRRLLAKEGLSVTIYCHEPPSHLNLTSIHQQFAEHVRIVPGRFLFGEKIVLSNLPWLDLFSTYDVVYVEGNPRYVSLALLATLLRLTGRRVVLWAMVHSFRNFPFGLALRLAWYRMFSQILVYSDAEANYLSAKGFGGQIVGINNGVDYELISKAAEAWSISKLRAWGSSNGISGRKIILSCSRLDKKNKFEQILQVLPQIIEKHPGLLWCIIGDGPERIALEAQTLQLGLKSHVRFLGQMYDKNEQAPWFLSSQMLVHPGAIGLTLLHAMAFGLPVITHNDPKRHGPEFAAMIPGEHGLTHSEDALAEIANSVLELLDKDRQSRAMGQAGQKVVRDRYNTGVMAERFLKMIESQTSIEKATF